MSNLPTGILRYFIISHNTRVDCVFIIAYLSFRILANSGHSTPTHQITHSLVLPWKNRRSLTLGSGRTKLLFMAKKVVSMRMYDVLLYIKKFSSKNRGIFGGRCLDNQSVKVLSTYFFLHLGYLLYNCSIRQRFLCQTYFGY